MVCTRGTPHRSCAMTLMCVKESCFIITYYHRLFHPAVVRFSMESLSIPAAFNFSGNPLFFAISTRTSGLPLIKFLSTYTCVCSPAVYIRAMPRECREPCSSKHILPDGRALACTGKCCRPAGHAGVGKGGCACAVPCQWIRQSQCPPVPPKPLTPWHDLSF